MARTPLPAIVTALAICLSAPAQASEPPAGTPSVVRADTAADEPPADREFWTFRLFGYIALGPLQGVLSPGIGWRRELKSPNPIFNNTYIEAGIDLPVNPTLVIVRPYFEVTPLAILKLQVAWMGVTWTGVTLGRGHSVTFDSKDSDTSPAALEAREDDGEVLFGSRFNVTTQLRVKAGPVALLNDTELVMWYVPGQGWLYDSFYDSLIERGGVDGSLMNRTLLLGEVYTWGDGGSLLVGAVNEYVLHFHADRERDRFGGVVVLNVPNDELGPLDRPQFVLMAGAALIDKYRQYEAYGLVSFRFGFDFTE